MSGHDEPYANGLGILIGIAILWVGTLALVFAVKALFFPSAAVEGDPAAEGEAEESAMILPSEHERARDLFEEAYGLSTTAISRV